MVIHQQAQPANIFHLSGMISTKIMIFVYYSYDIVVMDSVCFRCEQ